MRRNRWVLAISAVVLQCSLQGCGNDAGPGPEPTPTPLPELSWSSAGLAGESIRSVAFDPASAATLYVATTQGLYKSLDRGGQWIPLNTSIYVQGARPFHGMWIAPTNPPVIFVAGSKVLFQSTNLGASWRLITTIQFGTRSLGFDAATPQNIYLSFIADSFDRVGRFGVSPDAGTSWAVKQMAGLPPAQAMAVDPKAPGTVYVGCPCQGLGKTTDAGRTWSARTSFPGVTSPCIYALAIDPSNPQTVYAGLSEPQGGGPGMIKSSDGGASWASISTGIEGQVVRALAIDPSSTGTLCAGTEGQGVFCSLDGGATWKASSKGLTALSVSALAFDPGDPSRLYAGTSNGLFAANLGHR